MSESRIGNYLEALLSGNTDVVEPQSRIEELLYALCKNGISGEGGGGLPIVTTADNDKIPRVVNGAWALVKIANAEEGEF